MNPGPTCESIEDQRLRPQSAAVFLSDLAVARAETLAAFESVRGAGVIER